MKLSPVFLRQIPLDTTNLTSLLIAKDEASLKAKKERMKLPDPLRGYELTVPQVIELVGGYQDVGSQMMILSSYKNDVETLDLFAAEVVPKFE